MSAMTGPEHYREAQRLLSEPDDRLPEALVHAQLATAAAIIATTNTHVTADWTRVTTGVPPAADDEP